MNETQESISYKKEYEATLIVKEQLNSDTCLLSFECPEIANSAKPGQFVNISCSYFLKRPFGVASVNTFDNTFSIGVKAVGKGSLEITKLEEGAKVNVLGPLGNGFDFTGFDSFILVAGGTGVFPINFAEEYLTMNSYKHVVVQGFRCKDQIVMNNKDYILATDNGDAGIHGNCCDALKTIDLSEYPNPAVCCVGPLPMMKAVGEWATSVGLKCFVSMEQRMACGIGICLVCVCKLKAEAEGEEFKHVRCCKDGPVFPFEEVEF